jgi:hypothetical protein
MTVSMHKTMAALNLPTSVPALLGVADAIVLAMTGNPAFPDPSPALATVAAAIAALRDAEVATHTRTRGTVAARNEQRAVLVSLLVRLKAYVQGVSDGDADRAPALIQSAGMDVKRSAAFAKPAFSVRPGRWSGSVRLAVRSAGDRAGYEWAWTDDGGATWQSAPTTLRAHTVIAGLLRGSVCSFRYRAVTKGGEGDWCEPMALLVP